MRLSRATERRIAKQHSREMAMVGWSKDTREVGRPRTDIRSTQRWVSFGMGHHLARMMKGHI